MKSYLITDPKYYTNNIQEFCKILQNTITKNQIDMICFRDKISSNFEELASIFVEISKKNNIPNIFINQNIILAKKLNASGVHLTSLQFDKISDAKNLELKIIISCHTKEEIQKAIELKVDFVTYSPIFDTPNKGKPKGIKNLKDIVDQFNIPIIALGGIVTKEHINKIQNTNCYGFASIRYFNVQ